MQLSVHVNNHHRRTQPRGFSAVEALVSMTILSIASIGMLSAMSSANLASQEEYVDSDLQRSTRVLMEDLSRDLEQASIVYMPSPGSPTLGLPIATNDSDNSNNTYLLLKYQVPLTVTDPASPDFGSPLLYPFNAANVTQTGIAMHGSYSPVTGLAIDTGCYSLLFKMDQRYPLIKEANPATIQSPVAGTQWVYRDLDGDGAYTSVFAMGHIERRVTSNLFSSANPGQTSANDVLDKAYEQEVLVPWDAANNSPMNTMFTWWESPGLCQNYGYIADGIYHSYIHPLPPNPPPIAIPEYVSPTVNPSGWHSRGPLESAWDDGQWEPILQIQLLFLPRLANDGRKDNTMKLKSASTLIYLRSQSRL